MGYDMELFALSYV